MAKDKVEEGDIILLPLTLKNDFAVAKVLFLSNYWKDLMLLAVSTAGTVSEAKKPTPLPKLDLLIYTSVRGVGTSWLKVGHDPSPIDPEVSRRTVTGMVWLRDEKLHLASPEEAKALPRQGLAGIGLVTKKLQDALGLPRVDLDEPSAPPPNPVAMMDDKRFWALIELAWKAAPEAAAARPDGKAVAPAKKALAAVDDALEKKMIPALKKAIAALPSAKLAAFDRTLERKLYELDRADVQRHTDGSDDGFLYARGFIVAMGRAYYEAVVADPSCAIADMECESITYLAKQLYEASHGALPPSGISRETGSNKAGWKKG